MRLKNLALTTLLVAAAPAAAQTPPAPQTQPPAATAAQQQALDGYMKRWEQEMQKVQTLAAQLVREEKDTTFNTKQKFVGFAQYQKNSNLNQAMLEMRPDGKQEVSERYICTGRHLYQYVPVQKEIRRYDMPAQQPGQVSNDSFLSFLFGMRADDAKQRYDLRPGKEKLEDQFYIYVDILPRNPQDMGDFKRARIVLSKETFLPRQLWFEQPNGSEVTWDIPAIKAGIQVNPTFFQDPQAPQGWKLVPVARNAEAPPTVVRPRN